ncbi:helix-turn-helix domain-containing protein [Enterobacter hormaechei]|uniref:helix-turn-helix domain-containing protein n=1 Tax=Enterobacter hormaechei TaxID=158836 RepID=UPI001E37ED94|nr:helix-turn-helix transcriptional regulator [Enterobacter hormaechei]
MMIANNLFSDDNFDFPEVSEREMACERLIFNTTEDLLLAMQDANISQSELAKKLGKSKGHVSQLLDGTRNMTLKTLSDMAYALGAVAKVVILREGVDVSHAIIPDMKRLVWKAADVSDNPGQTIKITIKTSNAEYQTKCY